MKKGLLILFILSSFNSKGTTHQIQVWSGYMQFLPPNNIIVQLGDTIQWIPLDPPTMSHTITSNNIPGGAVPFDQVWQMPADTFFQYIPQVAGLYQYVCTPHIPNGMIGEFTVINGSTAQKTYVPDDNFENYLEGSGMGDGIPLNDSVLTSNINTITHLIVYAMNIADLTGIEDFSALTVLRCDVNQLSFLDVSQNTTLTYLECWSNQLTSLNLSNNTSLTILSCESNQLTSLDVSNNANLESLMCFSNQIISLDVSQNIALTFLSCWDNQLSSLDVSQNINLENLGVENNQLTSLDVSQNSELIYLACGYNQLTFLDVRNGNNMNITTSSPNGTGFWSMNNPELTCINVDDSLWSTNNWTVANLSIDPQQYFSTNCIGTTSIEEYTTNKELLKITDLLGRETKQTNQPLFYIYNDGTIEKKIIIE